ncbi:hypothetical protein [Thalassobaculum sp.]|uniref:hypothetical protein n=1 Tax=Thalassobaculum sp. TaxID=2022740 RepID=UPI0032EAA1B6
MHRVYTVVHTRWIGRDGRDEDLKSRVGRLGDDVSVFAIHTLGWIQVLEIARFLEIRFDPRATGPAAIAALDGLLYSLERSETPWLVKMHVFNGKTWIETTDTDAARLSRFVHDCVSFCERPDVPSALRTEILGDGEFRHLADPLIDRISAAWRGHGGRIDHELMAEVGSGTYGNVKMLTLLDDNRLVFNHYRASITGPWDNATWASFSGRDVRQAVPDRALADAVDRSARRVLAGAAPMLEHWSGPILTSKGAAMYDWLRASFPVQLRDGRGRDGGTTVLVVCVPSRTAYRATA